MNAKTLLKDARKLKSKMYKVQGDTYYDLEEQLRHKLNDILDSDLETLNKRQLVELISYCSSHRPKALHVILMDIGALHKGGEL